MIKRMMLRHRDIQRCTLSEAYIVGRVGKRFVRGECFPLLGSHGLYSTLVISRETLRHKAIRWCTRVLAYKVGAEWAEWASYASNA